MLPEKKNIFQLKKKFKEAKLLCGITGFVGLEDRDLLIKMTRILEHRGPDDYGLFIDSGIGLGHQRLSIMDSSSSVKTPIANENDDIHIISDGKIYNYREIRLQLEEMGHLFRSKTDNEVILHGYEEWGLKETLSRLNGMFAFVIWDSNKKELLLARDRLGIKPVCYWLNSENNILLFGSEIKSLLLFEEIDKDINFNVLRNFLTFRCSEIDQSFFNKIFKIPPGNYAVFNEKSQEFTIQPYWNFQMNKRSELNKNQAINMLFNILQDSIKKRLISDAHLGAFLSGGIDSSTIVAIMSNLIDTPVKTFAVGFGEQDISYTLEKARIVSEHFDTDHHELIVEPDAAELLPRLIWHTDEPLADPTIIPTFILSQFTKKECSVALTGDGADELFAGYPLYKFLKIRSKYFRIFPQMFRKYVLNPILNITPFVFLNIISKYSKALGKEGKERIKRVMVANSPIEWFLELVSIFNDVEKCDLLATETILLKNNDFTVFNRLIENYFKEKQKNLKTFLNELLFLETKTTLVEDSLAKVDKMAMANSLETRLPFLDHRLVEFMSHIDYDLKLRKMRDKYLLRELMKSKLPKKIVRAKKDYFFVPIHRWMEKELFDLTFNLVDYDHNSPFSSKYLKKIKCNFHTSPLFYSRQLWCILTFEIWKGIYIEGSIKNNQRLVI